MKLSIAWIFDHIDALWQEQDINHLVSRFNQVTAEIEHVHTVNFDLRHFFLARVEKITQESVLISIPESGKETTLPLRDDLQAMLPGSAFLVKDDGRVIRWASCKDFDLEKDAPLVALAADEQALAGAWRSQFEAKDIILEVDNKSVTHRPDMWGHRGFAREVAALLDLPFKDQAPLLAHKEISYAAAASMATADNPIAVENKEPEICTRFSGLYFSAATPQPSSILMASRLMKVGARPINALVDLTNYVMHDWSQPMHVFDAEKIGGKKIVIRRAKQGEKLSLLDGSTLELTAEDLVIADAKHPLSLAGVKGGASSGVSADTKTIFVESAHFTAEPIRRSAQRHKLRTDSSARFEKTLDPNQITDATLRFLFLAQKIGLALKAAPSIVCLGTPVAEKHLKVTHEFLQSRAGFALTRDDVVCPLEKIGFRITENHGAYEIVIPSFRGTKDVSIPEDILEEVVRFYGFDRITLELPAMTLQPHELHHVFAARTIKHHLAHGVGMSEVCNYALYDETFLTTLGWDAGVHAVSLTNPLSQLYTRLATSLVPHLLKNVADNFAAADRMAFFECARTWRGEGDAIIEQKKVSGVFFDKRAALNFYTCKTQVTSLFSALGLVAAWRKSDHAQCSAMPWLSVYQSAAVSIRLGNREQLVGFAGRVEPLFLSKLDVLPESDAFVFEFDLDLLCALKKQPHQLVPLPRYQEVSFDLSFLVPLNVTTIDLEESLRRAHKLVHAVSLLDFFEHERWPDQRAIAFSVTIAHPEKTLEKEEIENARETLIRVATSKGAVLRA